jgi:hypothetical protein
MVKRLLPLVGGAKESAGTIACAWHVRLMPQHQMHRGQEVGGSLTSRSPAGGPGSRWPKPAGRRAEDQRAAPSHARRCFATWLRSRTAFARHCSGSAIAPTRLISTTVRGPTQRSSISGSSRSTPVLFSSTSRHRRCRTRLPRRRCRSAQRRAHSPRLRCPSRPVRDPTGCLRPKAGERACHRRSDTARSAGHQDISPGIIEMIKGCFMDDVATQSRADDAPA